MLALYRSGQQAEALQVYQKARRVLVEELGLEPSPVLEDMERAILLADSTLVSALTAADGLTQLAPRRGPCQLPPDIDDFTGRQAAVAEVQRLLEREQATAIVISAIAGKAGVGKTALVVRVGHRLRPRFADGQLYANLHGIEAHPRNPADVIAEFLRALRASACWRAWSTPSSWRRPSRTRPASYATVAESAGPRLFVVLLQLLRAGSTQNSLPSGSARTTHGDDPCPTSAGRAPARRNRSTSACWSSGRRSR
jgi:hypothetical protein